MKTTRKLFPVLLAFTLLSHGIVSADGKPSIAVYPTVSGKAAAVLQHENFDTQEITRRLEEALRATRRFSVFERSEAVLKEVALKEQDLAESDLFKANAAEFGKLNNVALIIQPFIAEFRLGSEFEEVDNLPGMFERTDSGKISLTCKVLDTTTGEIKFQLTTQWGFEKEAEVVDEKKGGPGGEDWIRMARKVGTRSAAGLVNSIFPIMVIKFSKNRLFLNRGAGGGIEKGDLLELFSVGEALIDPQTGESLGGEEFSIGQIRVIKVKPKYSVAVPVDELDDDPKPGDIARR